MARRINQLSARRIASEKKAGYHADGGGLYLQVTAAGAKSWLFRFALNKKERWMGLGPTHTVSLSDAREKAGKCREMVRQGVDPIEARKSDYQRRKLEAANAVTFKDCAERYITSHETGWSSEKHASQWRNTLRDYAYPFLGSLPVGEIDTGLVMRVLEPIWTLKPETAGRIRGRIESVLDYATTLKYCEGENPARWRGHLKNLLPAHSKVRSIKHHPALPYSDIGDFMAALRIRDGVSAKGLEFLVLTAARTGEVIGGQWSEADPNSAEWRVPADRMKTRQEHRVPLSPAAMDVLEGMAKTRQSEFMFPGARPRRPLSNMAFLTLMDRMDYGEYTPHGFRSSFRDWASEQTAFPSEVVEMALAHTITSKTERAYRRGELLEKRRQLMNAWAKFCNTPSSKKSYNVVSLKQPAS